MRFISRRTIRTRRRGRSWSQKIALDVRGSRRRIKSGHVSVAEGVIVESRAHHLARARPRDVLVSLIERCIAAAGRRIVGELDL